MAVSFVDAHFVGRFGVEAVRDGQAEPAGEELLKRPILIELDLPGPSTQGDYAFEIVARAGGVEGLRERYDSFDGSEAEFHLIHDNAGELVKSRLVVIGEMLGAKSMTLMVSRR